MIYRLQRKFILISALSIFSVILIIFGVMTALNISSMNKTLDILADGISVGGGRFPDRFGDHEPIGEKPEVPKFDYITPETPFSTRYFTVWFDKEGETVRADTEFIYSIDDDTACQYARQAFDRGRQRGWISSYRYKLYATEAGYAAVFVDASMNRASLLQNIIISASVLLVSAMLVMLLIVFLSRKAVKPVAESYEKQKQFVTDVNHELKTPLTLILANIDIAETELGKNEWLEDIRTESREMTRLVEQLVDLSRMDEDESSKRYDQISLYDVIIGVVSDFSEVAQNRGVKIITECENEAVCRGDEIMLRRLMSILLDNAIKYCDVGGKIVLSLKGRRHSVITVTNTYADVDKVAFDRLFDRFYRDDNARARADGYGIGLSIARSIVRKHRGEISAYKKDSENIEFKVIIK